jgi:hypothetical protein
VALMEKDDEALAGMRQQCFLIIFI